MMRKYVLIAIVLLSIATATFLLIETAKDNSGTSLMKTENFSCVSSTENRTVRGNSLSGLIENNSTVRILFGYYSCNEISRGDIVAYNYAGGANPIIKIVRGIPGDKFSLQKTEGGWNILINNEAVKNSKGEIYSLSESGSKMLLLYERDYKGVIPANAYLILGNLASGSIDSTQFGLIGKQDILGKAELIHYAF